MKNKIISGLFVSLLIINISSIPIPSISTSEKRDVIIVDNEGDGDYININDAIASANPGDTIEVYSGIYQEYVVIDKPLTLKGIPEEYGNGTDFGKPIIDGQYHMNKDGVTISANDCIIQGFEIINVGCGVFINKIINIFIEDNEIHNTGVGIGMNKMPWENNMNENITITSNLIYDNTHNGIVIRGDKNLIYNNIIFNNSKYGILIDISKRNSITKNHIYQNDYGLFFSNSERNLVSGNTINDNYVSGIFMSCSYYTTIIKNVLINNYYAIKMAKSSDPETIGTCTNNEIYQNDISDNSYGLVIIPSLSNNNKIYHNSFDNKVKNAEDKVSIALKNQWDNDYPSGGNYWSDYTGNDNNGDGIGDTPYGIDPRPLFNKDKYPLMNPFNMQSLNPATPKLTFSINSGKTHVSHEYDFFAIDPEDDDIYYIIDWGDGNITTTALMNQGILLHMSHTWDSPKIYYVSVIAFDQNGYQSNSLVFTVEIYNNRPPSTPVCVRGIRFGKVGEEYEYAFLSTDPDNDFLFYYIDWGDGSNSGWLGPFLPGEFCWASHSWEQKNTYKITIKAKDTDGLESDWGTCSIIMPRTYSFYNIFENIQNSFLMKILLVLIKKTTLFI